MLRKKSHAIALAVAVGLLAVALSLVLAQQISYRQAVSEQGARAARLAAEVVRRTDAASQQVFISIPSLESLDSPEPCSPDMLDVMRKMAFRFDQLLGVGYIQNERLICSSFGHHGEGLPVGPPDYINRFGVEIRSSVEFPFAPGAQILIPARQSSGYAAMVHRNQPVDVLVDDTDVQMGTFGANSHQIMVNRGYFDPAWLKLLGDRYEAEIQLGNRILVFKRSRKFDFAAYVAVPAVAAGAGSQRSLILLALGMGVGLLVAVAAFFVLRQQLSTPSLIRNALRWNEFSMVYQPVVDLQTGLWVGAEALIRWQRSNGERVSPDIFIPIAEQTGLIGAITERVIKLVLHDCKALLQHHPDLHIGLNLAASDLASETLVTRLDQALRQAQINPSQIMVEATERGLLNTDSTKLTLQALRDMGVHVAVDDFGTGYSNLSSLTALPLNYLKIDKSFVDALGTDAATSDVVPHIIEIARTLKLDMIAEGVETEAQAEFLRAHGVQYAQGWLFARAMPIAEFRSQIKVQRQVSWDTVASALQPMA